MKVGIIGLGLIGGSIALELKKVGFAEKIFGKDASPEHAAKALQLGIVDEIITDFKEVDVMIVSVPVHATCLVVADLLDQIKSNTVIIDTGSTKGVICKAVEHHPNRQHFVAAHPIAGTEFSGPDAAIYGLFKGKANIICEKEKSSEAAFQLASKLFEALGMHTVLMNPIEHDKHLAYVSHLSHVSSFLLGQTVLDIEKDEKNIFELAGAGFESTVRLAKSSPDTWVPIFEQNVEYLGQALMEYIMHLQRFHYHLMKRDTKSIQNALLQANDIKRVLNNRNNKKT